MNTRILLLIPFSLFLNYAISFGQSNCNIEQLKVCIDSIAKSKNISNASVIYLYSVTFMDSESMWETTLSKMQKFRFEGPFLVLSESYYNLDKLLYFNIKDNCIEFFVQAY